MVLVGDLLDFFSCSRNFCLEMKSLMKRDWDCAASCRKCSRPVKDSAKILKILAKIIKDPKILGLKSHQILEDLVDVYEDLPLLRSNPHHL